MNINGLNHSPNFSGLYVDTDGMGSTASAMAESLSRKIEYSDEVDRLDKMGVDVIIIQDPKNKEDRAKVIFADGDNRLYKIDGKDHLKTDKFFDIGFKQTYYSDNANSVFSAMKGILNGTFQKKTTRPTQTQREMLEKFPIRDNVLDRQEPECGHSIDFCDC